MITANRFSLLLSFFRNRADIGLLNNSAKIRKTKRFEVPESFSVMTTVACPSWAAAKLSRNAIGIPLPLIFPSIGQFNRKE